MPVYHDLGFNLLLVDQRAQNGSAGRYITFGVRESRDVRPWVELHNREFGPEPVFLGGVSMGATTVLMAAGGPLPETSGGLWLTVASPPRGRSWQPWQSTGLIFRRSHVVFSEFLVPPPGRF